ncbi:MAG: transposase [Bacillota bacterium]|nr:transposase [Bacillota bacterium]
MYYSDEEKVKLVELISASRLLVKKAAKEYGISDASFYAWRKQLQAAASQNKEEKQPGCEP